MKSLLTSGLSNQAATPEMGLLVACACNSLDPAASQPVRQLSQPPLDWSHFLELAAQHGLLSCCHSALAPQTDVVPEDIRAALRNDCLIFSMRAMQLSAELVRLTQRLNESGIEVLAYKGPVLSQILYGNVAKRHFQDLDIIVDESALPQATGAILSEGYQSGFEWEWEHSFVRDDLRISVDVHWAFAHQSLRFDLPFEDVWRRRRIVTINHTSLATLGKEDTLIVQCINAAKDDWSSLGQIFEIGQIVAQNLDWTNLLEQTESVGCQRIVLLGLSLTSQLFAAPLPAAAAKLIHSDSDSQALSTEIAGRLIQASETNNKVMQLDRLHARSRERLRERLPHYRRMLRHTVMPNEKDFEFLSLPRVLFPLYFVVRPIRLVYKYRSTILLSRAKRTRRSRE